MEYATGALGTLLPKLGQLLLDEYRLQKGAKKTIDRLTIELKSIEAALHDIGQVPMDQHSEVVRNWAREAREMSYDMEDMVDTFLVRVQGPDERPGKRKVKRFFKKLWDDVVTKAKIRRDIGQEIDDIMKRVEEMAERRERYKFDYITPDKTDSYDPRIAFLKTKATELIGIDKAKEEVITLLTKGDNDLSAKQRIISVVGFGGLGKTTLANAVYDKLKGQFDCTVFVSVGRNPDNIKHILWKILMELDKGRCEKINLSIFNVEMHLINELQDFLGNKRYFIVIDDIWDTRSWERINSALVANNSGSRIIITTRKYEVAQKTGGIIYRLAPLSYDNSRKLFFARIYDGESKASNHQPDDEVSDKILKKCGGIPLAIITMASLLEGKHREDWSEVLHSIGFASKENEQVKNTEEIISYSYYDLPSHLRTCLLYLSVFPEDYFIEKNALIWMWIAEDFVPKKQGIMSSFEIGERWFTELVNRSMIQLVEKLDERVSREEEEEEEEWYGRNCKLVHGCRVHDMVLDLICSISSEENFVTILDNKEGQSSSSSQGKVHRLALHNNRTVESYMVGMGRVRSFISCGCDIDKGIPLSSFTLIRVLAIYIGVFGGEHRHLKHLRNLLHLRYLRLSGGVAELPEEIGTLKFLETLHVYRLLNPKVVNLLTQLRCLRLDLGNSVSATMFTDGIMMLTSLEELEINFFWSAYEDQEPRRRFMKELGSLRELKVLRLCCHRLSTEEQIDLIKSLRSLGKMMDLSLKASTSADTATWETAGFHLPRRIRYLHLNWISFSRFPSFCINSLCLPNLTHLSLCVDAIEEQELQILGLLPELCFLYLKVESTTEIMVCSAADTTDPACDGGRLFKKLRYCTLSPAEVLLVPSKDDNSCGVSFCMRHVSHATVLLGSEWNGVSSGRGLAAAIMQRVHKLQFDVSSVREFKDENHWDGLCLEYFASLQNIKVNIYVHDAFDDTEVEEVKASLQHAADVHPKHPTVKTSRHGSPGFQSKLLIDKSRQAHQAEIEQQQDVDDEAGSSKRD